MFIVVQTRSRLYNKFEIGLVGKKNEKRNAAGRRNKSVHRSRTHGIIGKGGIKMESWRGGKTLQTRYAKIRAY